MSPKKQPRERRQPAAKAERTGYRNDPLPVSGELTLYGYGRELVGTGEVIRYDREGKIVSGGRPARPQAYQRPRRTKAKTYVLVPRTDYQALIERLEDLEDAELVREAEARGGPSRSALPAALVKRLLAGEHPVRIWREHRGLTLAALSEKAGVPDGYISEIETGKKPGSARALKALAQALEVDLDELVP